MKHVLIGIRKPAEKEIYFLQAQPVEEFDVSRDSNDTSPEKETGK